MKDLHTLPRVEDSFSYIYLEHGRLEQDALSVAFYDADGGKTQIPASALCVILLGPGTTVTHAAITACAENGCLIGWCGEECVRYYASGWGETRKSRHLTRQALLVSHPKARYLVVNKMYRKRFNTDLSPELSLEQIRGMEGVRIRDAYAQASNETGVPWHGRRYDPKNWSAGDPINKALSAANACLYAVCHAAIISAGYSPGLGFIHQGTNLSFVYDIADLYKTDTTIPLSFKVVKESSADISRRVRTACRDYFHQTRMLNRIIPDIEELLGEDEALINELERDSAEWQVANLWEPDNPEGISGGRKW
jgi:CRISPR-associated protein Cas1